MSDYTKLTDFAAKDALASGNPSKLVLGTEIDDEFNAIAAAIATKTDGNGSISVGDKGDITVSSAGTVWTIDDGAVTLAKMASMATDKFLGRITAATGVPEVFTLNDITALTSPDNTADYVLVWDASASAHRKVLIEYLLGIAQNAQAGNYTLTMADNGRHIYHASGDGAGDTYTIDSNANLALPVGFTVTFVNMASDTVSIAITTDTMYLAGTGATGTRTLAQYGVATAIKLTSTTWIISGTGLS